MSATTEAYAAASPNDVSFIVTGFGPFRDAKDNPTTVIAKKLKDYIENNNLNLHLVSTVVIETSAEAARYETDKLKQQFASKKGTTFLLHLGVDFRSSNFQLEQCAYNEAHFRIPDEKGYQPRNKTVIDGCDPSLTTRLDVQKLHTNLELDSVVMSTDPGRFVCNYTYYCSLSKLQQDDSNVYSFFIHVPPFAKIPEEEQFRIVTLIMEGIRKQLSFREAIAA